MLVFSCWYFKFDSNLTFSVHEFVLAAIDVEGDEGKVGGVQGTRTVLCKGSQLVLVLLLVLMLLLLLLVHVDVIFGDVIYDVESFWGSGKSLKITSLLCSNIFDLRL